MPIRTNRGRAAVYRRIWGWPMRSPAHLAGTLLVFAAIITGVGIAMPKLFATQDGGDGAISQASNGRSTATETSSAADYPGPDGATGAMPTRLTEPLVTPGSAAPDPDALTVAETWAKAWVDHPDGTTNESWLRGLEPYTTAEFLAVMSSVDPANVPSSQVTGDAEAASSFDKSVVALVPTDGARLRITVVETGNGWRVARYEKAG